LITTKSCDVLIVGAGVVGLAIGLAILESRPTSKVIMLEKESVLGKHASGRNSGVLHAGFYYSPDSLKAKFCRDGNFELRELCREFDIPLKEVGKVVVSRSETEDLRLDDLLKRGEANGVALELLPKAQLADFEPLAKTYERFLWSPNTAISDSSSVLAAMRSKFLSHGGELIYDAAADLKVIQDEVVIAGYNATIVINAAGAQADRIARKLGLAKDYAMVPFMGLYRKTNAELLPLQKLVYPVPHPINPFLGVHFTLTLTGSVKIGPTAIPVLGREQYSLWSGWSISDMHQAIIGAAALISGDAHNFGEILKSELPKILQRSLVNQAAELVPTAASVKKWQRQQPGIRAQLVNKRTGELEQDFIVEQSHNSIHVLNAVSPGWTSSIPFGRWIAQSNVFPKL
jgi:L-2-hydroxyglutarate oxidase LhgO